SEEMQQEIAERKGAEEALRQAHDVLKRQNRQLERVHELTLSAVEQMMNLIGRGATTDELLGNLRMVQVEFERLNKQNLNGN
ncbi:MAG: hypothetical protein L0Z53_07520, partial [Acidobacteriales bacterium]|nr:hypothetical protein [Terriglobales bacterium]